MVLQITEQAKEQILEMLQSEKNDQLRLRFGVKSGDCNGFSYSLGFDQNLDEQLDYTDKINDIPITIKKEDIDMIEGTTIDFKQNMMGGGFTIDNPNADIPCDCSSTSNSNKREGVTRNC